MAIRSENTKAIRVMNKKITARSSPLEIESLNLDQLR